MKVALEILELSIYMLQLSVLVPELGCELLHFPVHFIVRSAILLLLASLCFIYPFDLLF